MQTCWRLRLLEKSLAKVASSKQFLILPFPGGPHMDKEPLMFLIHSFCWNDALLGPAVQAANARAGRQHVSAGHAHLEVQHGLQHSLGRGQQKLPRRDPRNNVHLLVHYPEKVYSPWCPQPAIVLLLRLAVQVRLRTQAFARLDKAIRPEQEGGEAQDSQ